MRFYICSTRTAIYHEIMCTRSNARALNYSYFHEPGYGFIFIIIHQELKLDNILLDTTTVLELKFSAVKIKEALIVSTKYFVPFCQCWLIKQCVALQFSDDCLNKFPLYYNGIFNNFIEISVRSIDSLFIIFLTVMIRGPPVLQNVVIQFATLVEFELDGILHMIFNTIRDEYK